MINRFFFFLFSFFLVTTALSQVKLPRLISDGMVLQRNVELKVWGWAAPQEKVTVNFLNQIYQATADAQGNWSVKLPSLKAGGPFTMDVQASNTVNIKNILVGEVWVCSGQSNMELTMDRAKDKYKTEIENCANENIRQFLVPDKYDFKKENSDLDGGSWESANPKSIYTFSAVGYFFAKELYDKYKVPVGLINAALGGSPAEAWVSEDALKQFPNLYQEAQRFKDDKVIQEIETNDKARSDNWYKELNGKDLGVSSKWKDSQLSDSDWLEMTVPGFWADGPMGKINGSVWFRRVVSIPKSMTGKPGKLWLGRIVDADSVFINGKFVGATGYQYPPRKYSFNENILQEGLNTIAIRVINNSGRGGFVLDKPYFLTVNNDTLDLKGTWKYKLGTEMPALAGPTAIRWKPTGLYNKMIAPLLPYSIKGVIWYQGESNTGRAKEYETLFPALITNWREKWKQGNFPFLFVQLANFVDPGSPAEKKQWAGFRGAQMKALALPNTGMAVTIDIGEWNDIHPLNKEDVGKRLALAAQKIAYGDKEVAYSGPILVSHVINGDKIILKFQPGNKLVAKGGELKHFEIAGDDKKFVQAKATIKHNIITVWADEIKKPVVVRYAWADNPEGANLFNDAGLPASPFTTDK